jgi:hypothetical protein
VRGGTSRQATVLGWMDPGQSNPANHPIRKIRPLAEAAQKHLGTTSGGMCAQIGSPSIPRERLLTSRLRTALYSFRSERQFCEWLRNDPLLKWVLG